MSASGYPLDRLAKTGEARFVAQDTNISADPIATTSHVLEIAHRLSMEVRWAVERRAVMEAANDVIGQLNVSHGVLAYNILHATMVRSLTMEVAAAFDPRGKARASIPALIHYLGVVGVKKRLLEKADLRGKGSREECAAAFQRIVDRTAACEADSMHKHNLRKVREARNFALAHHVVGAEYQTPSYGELFGVMDVMRTYAADAHLVAFAIEETFEEVERTARHSARDLWIRALREGRVPDCGAQGIVLPRHVDSHG
jgi:hypothetical protein